ncbi:hypothetical protein [Nonomuraea rosea]
MSREIRLAAVPAAGSPGPEHFELAEVPLPVPDEGRVLVRNRFFHVFAALRTLLGASARATPVPPLHPGDTLYGPAIGEVVSAPGGNGLRAGDLVAHRLGWREYAVVPAGQVSPLGEALPDPVAHLGQGALAYTALTRDAEVRPGDTVFVSGAAGGVGSLAGPIARLLGAGRVIGSTGSREKADRLIRELLSLGLTIEDLRGCAERLRLLDDDTLPPRGGPGCSTESGVAERRLADLDAEIARLSLLRERLAGRAGRVE